MIRRPSSGYASSWPLWLDEAIISPVTEGAGDGFTCEPSYRRAGTGQSSGPGGRLRPGFGGYARTGPGVCLPGLSSGETMPPRSSPRGAGTLGGSDQENLMEVTGRSAESLEILARALHVKNAELQPTLEAIVATAVTMLSPARYAGLTISRSRRAHSPGHHRRAAPAT